MLAGLGSGIAVMEVMASIAESECQQVEPTGTPAAVGAASALCAMPLAICPIAGHLPKPEVWSA